MNPLRGPAQLIAITLCWSAVAIADAQDDGEIDPFASEAEAAPKLREGEFFTAAGLTVKPIEGWNPQLVGQDDLPDVTQPTQFNRSFERPTAIWRVDGGFLGSFNAGEFGGALFFAQQGAKRWVKILDGHISSLERFEGDTYLAVGGLAHLHISEGRAFLLTRSKTGKWKSKMAFETQVGVPLIVGTTFTEPIFESKAEKLIVVALDSHWGWNPLFGISQQGAVHYLGERLKQKGSEQGVAPQSATRSESDSEGSDKPQPGSDTRSR